MEVDLRKDLGIKTSMSEPEALPDSKEVQKWLDEVADAKEREKNFRKEGTRVTLLFEGAKKAENSFNILYSNTETLLPVIYNSVPRPVVQRRFKDEDPLGKMASQATTRLLEYLIDEGNPDHTSFDELMKAGTLEALVPGRGVSRFSYYATFVEAQNLEAAEANPGPEEVEEAAEGKEEAVIEEVDYETVCGEEVPWDRFTHGQAKKWKDVPWVAFEHLMTREELEKSFGEKGALVPVKELSKGDSEEPSEKDKYQDLKGLKVAVVQEIWVKDSKKVYFVTENWKAGFLKEVDDPLELQGFFPMPKPMRFLEKISTLTPTALYVMYEEQAKELDRVSARINKLITMLKVRGLYDSTVEGLDKVLKADDGELVPAENVAAMLAQGNALEKAIWLFPLEKLVTVLQQLYVQRQQVKTVIYEITGIADIMRGSSQASETLGAQQIKNQWGTLRLKKTQKEVQRYARDCLRIMAEIGINKLAPETLKKMTGLPFPTQGEKQQAQLEMQMAQQNAAMTGQPAQPNPQLEAMLGMPSWEELQSLLQDDISRSYRIDIETNSTVDAEATEDKEDVSELLNAISQFLNGVGPLVQDGTMPFEVAQSMLLAVVRRYRFGPELEDSLKKMKPPVPKPDPKAEADKAKLAQEQQMAQADMQAKEMDNQAKQQELAGKQALMQQQAALEQEKMALERERFNMERLRMQREEELAQAEHMRKMELMSVQHAQKLAQARAPKPTQNTKP